MQSIWKGRGENMYLHALEFLSRWKKSNSPTIGKLLRNKFSVKEYSKAQLCGKKRVFAVKWSPQQRENRNLLSIFYLALQSVSSSCTFYFRNLIADTEVGTKMGTTDKQKALKSCDFKAFYWWGKVDSNHRSHWQQIYSLSPLATREFPHIQDAVLR